MIRAAIPCVKLVTPVSEPDSPRKRKTGNEECPGKAVGVGLLAIGTMAGVARVGSEERPVAWGDGGPIERDRRSPCYDARPDARAGACGSLFREVSSGTRIAGTESILQFVLELGRRPGRNTAEVPLLQ